MGDDLGVKVPAEPGHRDRREAQGSTREGRAEGSAERISGPMHKNRIEGDDDQGERANDREALVANERCRRSGGRGEKAIVLTWGDLALRLKGRR
jgi:hypothetical protein